MMLEGEDTISENVTEHPHIQPTINSETPPKLIIKKLFIITGVVCTINFFLSLFCSYSSKYFLALNSVLYLISLKYYTVNSVNIINLSELTITFLITIGIIFILTGAIDYFTICSNSCSYPCKVDKVKVDTNTTSLRI